MSLLILNGSDAENSEGPEITKSAINSSRQMDDSLLVFVGEGAPGVMNDRLSWVKPQEFWLAIADNYWLALVG